MKKQTKNELGVFKKYLLKKFLPDIFLHFEKKYRSKEVEIANLKKRINYYIEQKKGV